MDNKADQTLPDSVPPVPSSRPDVDPLAAQGSELAEPPVVQPPLQGAQEAPSPTGPFGPSNQPLVEQIPGGGTPTVEPADPESSRKKWLILGVASAVVLLAGIGIAMYIMTKPQPVKPAAAPQQTTPAAMVVAKMADSSSVGTGIDFLFTPPTGWAKDTSDSKLRYIGPSGSTYSFATLDTDYGKTCSTHTSCTTYVASLFLSNIKKNRGWVDATIEKEGLVEVPTDKKDFRVEVVHSTIVYTKNGIKGRADFYGRSMVTKTILALHDRPNSNEVKNPLEGLSIVTKDKNK